MLRIKTVYFSLIIFLIVANNRIFAKDSISVYLFLLDECRICQEIAPELNEIYNDYGSNFNILGVFPNFSSKLKGIQAFKEKYKIRFNTKTDYFKLLTKKFDATVLPEVIVYNETTKSVLYRGAINDLFYTQGKRKHSVSHYYLREALQSISENSVPAIKETKPLGCFINFNDSLN